VRCCYWYLSTGNHDMIDVHPANDFDGAMKWSGYSAIQARPRLMAARVWHPGRAVTGQAVLQELLLLARNIQCVDGRVGVPQVAVVRSGRSAT